MGIFWISSVCGATNSMLLNAFSAISLQCLFSDCHFGHYNRSCYLLTYLLTYLRVHRSVCGYKNVSQKIDMLNIQSPSYASSVTATTESIADMCATGSILLNIFICPTYPEKLVQDIVVARCLKPAKKIVIGLCWTLVTR